jgi:ABC-2 type transport system ATP-binding protein
MGEKEGFISFQNLTKKFGNNLVLNNLDLTIKREGIFGIMGLSGSGKTTLLNILVNFWKPDSGKILYNGLEISKHQHVFNQFFGFGTQAGSLYPKLTVRENMIYFGKMYNMKKSDIDKRITELLEFVDMKKSEETIAEELSTGMYRRLDIACALIHTPKILVLDEPTGNLDPVLRKRILALIKKIDDEGTKVIITSHLMGEAEDICDELAILHKGKIIAQDAPENLIEKYSKEEIIKFETNTHDYNALIAGLKTIGAKEVFQKRKYMYLYTPDAEETLYKLITLLKQKNQKLINIEVNKPKIEEVFESLTR